MCGGCFICLAGQASSVPSFQANAQWPQISDRFLQQMFDPTEKNMWNFGWSHDKLTLLYVLIPINLLTVHVFLIVLLWIKSNPFKTSQPKTNIAGHGTPPLRLLGTPCHCSVMPVVAMDRISNPMTFHGAKKRLQHKKWSANCTKIVAKSHSLKPNLTAKAPENRPCIPPQKGNESFSKHQFSGASFFSGRVNDWNKSCRAFQ